MLTNSEMLSPSTAQPHCTTLLYTLWCGGFQSTSCGLGSTVGVLKIPNAHNNIRHMAMVTCGQTTFDLATWSNKKKKGNSFNQTSAVINLVKRSRSLVFKLLYIFLVVPWTECFFAWQFELFLVTKHYYFDQYEYFNARNSFDVLSSL